MRDEIYYYCDLSTGEAIMPFSGGIFEQMRREHITLYTGEFGMRQLRRAIAALNGNDPYRDYIDYKMFPHLKALSNRFNNIVLSESVISWVDGHMRCSIPIKPYHPLDEMLYKYGREFDRKVLKRVNAFIEAERNLLYSY